MDNLVRTTITLPETLLQEAHYYAIAQKTNLSRLVRESLREKIKKPEKQAKKSLLKLAGSLNLGGKEPPTREELYDDYLKEKMGF